MDYVRSGFGIFGGSNPSSAPAESKDGGAEIVERLVNRVTSATLLDDRRDALRGIKSLSRKYRLEVGTQAMSSLVDVLKRDQTDAEIIGYALDTLFNVMNTTPLGEDDEEEEETPDSVENKNRAEFDESLGLQFTEIFIKDTENIALLSGLLDEYDFHVRWPTVKLIMVLLTNSTKVVQEALMAIPMAISKIMDLLSDSREVIRNDGLLLLIHLTKGNSNIQKIVAFENAFERLLDIVDEEEMSDGGVVVEDCLTLLLTLLKNNSSNQTFFKEGSFIKKLTPYFDFTQHQGLVWSAQKVTNLHLMIQLVRSLVSPSNPAQNTAACQRAMRLSGLLKQLCDILMASGIPADILTETINAVAEVIRGCADNQELFAGVMAPSTPPRPAIVVLLMSMVNEKQPFILRCAVLYCFQCYLFKNELGQKQVIETLLPSSSESSQSLSAGQLLCGGLFSNDALSNWFAAIALKAAIDDNEEMKRQLLRVQLATSLGQPPTTLLQQCCNMLQSPKLQTRMGILICLCTWIAGCYSAVAAFLSESTNVAYLISQISSTEGDDSEAVFQGVCAFFLGMTIHFNDDNVENFTRESLRSVIKQRIGLETFYDKLNGVVKHEAYTFASKHTQPQDGGNNGLDLIVDWAFTRLFKSLESTVVHSVQGESSLAPTRSSNDALPNGKESSPEILAEMEGLQQRLAQFEDAAKEKDQQLQVMQQQMAQYAAAKTALETYAREAQEAIQQLQDQNALLRAQKDGENGSSTEMITSLQGEIGQLKLELIRLEQAKAEDDSLIEGLKGQLTLSAEKTEPPPPPTESDKEKEMRAIIEELTTEMENLKRRVILQDEDVTRYKMQYETVFAQLQTMEESQRVEEERREDEAEAKRRDEEETTTIGVDDEETGSSQNAADYLERIKSANMEKLETLEKMNAMEINVRQTTQENQDLKIELETMKKDQDDFFVLLSSEEEKKNKYREMLKKMGVELEDSSDEEEEDDIDGGEEGEDE